MKEETKEKWYKSPPQPKTKEELNQIATDILQGKIWTDKHGSPNNDNFRMINLFHVGDMHEDIAKGELTIEDAAEVLKEFTGMQYEYLDKAGPLSVNGEPSFMSSKFLCVEDTRKVWDIYFKMKEAIDKVKDNEN